jgi:hypothetical protein
MPKRTDEEDGSGNWPMSNLWRKCKSTSKIISF